MKYRCKKCGTEFDVQFEVKCPKCGAVDWDCEPIYQFAHTYTGKPEIPATEE